jgi:NitT/TauT family transport system substrate-binding protein
LLWGVESGAFRRAGLDVDVQRASTGSAVVPAVVGGAYDIGASTLIPLMLARARNLPFQLIAPAGVYSADSPTGGLIMANTSNFKTGRDLNGQIVGVTALNGLDGLGAVAWVDSTGGDSKTLRMLEIPFPAMGQAVAAGRVAAGTLANPFFEQGIHDGTVSRLSYCYSAIAHRFMESAFFATSDYIAKNQGAVAKFRGVIGEAAVYANAHRAQMVQLISKFTGIEAKTLLEQHQHFVGTTLDVRLIQPIADAAVKYGAIPSVIDIRSMFDPNIL